jgi:hypothetical protein
MSDTKKVKLIFDGELIETECTVDASGEYVCKAEDGRFLKFPKDSDLPSEVKRHNDANKK